MTHKTDTFIAPVCLDDIEVIYEDQYLLVINKPSGLLTLSGKNPLNKDSVHFRILQKFPTAAMLHRLDFGTSGLLIISLNKEITRLLNKQFQEQQILKKYEAVLFGLMKKDSGFINLPIAKDSLNFPFVKICQLDGKPAISDYCVLERSEQSNTTHVLFTPKTGRTHQLRVHSKEIGHPILGDDLYAHPQALEMSSRLMLHACELTFTHPYSGKKIHISKQIDFAMDGTK